MSNIFVHFFAVTARLRRESALFYVLGKTNTRQQFFILFLNFDTVLKNSSPEKFANIWRIELDGISAINFETTRTHL